MRACRTYLGFRGVATVLRGCDTGHAGFVRPDPPWSGTLWHRCATVSGSSTVVRSGPGFGLEFFAGRLLARAVGRSSGDAGCVARAASRNAWPTRERSVRPDVSSGPRVWQCEAPTVERPATDASVRAAWLRWQLDEAVIGSARSAARPTRCRLKRYVRLR